MGEWRKMQRQERSARNWNNRQFYTTGLFYEANEIEYII